MTDPATIVVDIRPLGDAAGSPAGWTLQGRWTPNDAERRASWDLLVELVTRISVVPLGDDEGLLREALTSLHALFASTRETLKRHGPELAEERRGELSLAVISAHLLNGVLRPVLVEWHVRLQAHEAGSSGAPTHETERSWEAHGELRGLLRKLQAVMVKYAEVFAKASGAGEFVRSLMESVESSPPAAPRPPG